MNKKLPYSRKEAKEWGKKVLNGFITRSFYSIQNDFTFDAEGMRYNIQKLLDEVKPNGLIYEAILANSWDMTPSVFKEYMTVSAEETKGKTLLAGIVIDPRRYVALTKIRLMETWVTIVSR